MKIFVSHAITDKKLLIRIKQTLEPYGLELLIAEHSLDLEKTITAKIESMIVNCDVAIILLTKEGFNSNFVQQEIGYINSRKKPYLQLVEMGVEKKITGFNFGRDYILFDPNEPENSVDQIKFRLLNHWEQIRAKAQRIKQKQIETQKRKDNEAKIGFGILAGLVVLGLISK